jgi:polygalacturonase
MANRQNNIGITGGGLIDGRGREVANNLVKLIHGGIVKDPLSLDRPHETIRPMIIAFIACTDILMEDINIANAASWVQTYDQCKNLRVNRITVRSNVYWNNDGIDIVDCENVWVTNSFFDASDDAICLKSHDANYKCKNVLIRNNVARSGASGIKLGTASRGGFADIKVINNKVYDTFRSAFTIGAVDGGSVENVVVDSLTAMNTGNAIYLRVGVRSGERKSSMKNITLSNVYAEIPEGKPDKGYEYEGPVEDLPRNVSPSAIAGLSDNYITDVKLKNITIVYPGGGNPHYARCEATPEGLANIPEMERSYPEFSQFKELPAWAFFVRHAKNITFENVKVTAEKPDYRPAFVFDNVHGASLNGVTFIEPNADKKQQLYHHRSTGVTVVGNIRR